MSKNTITVGTSHFVDLNSAVRYYMPYNDGNWRVAKAEVDAKLKAGEIAIGAPEPGEGEIVLLNKREGRYFIEGPL